MKRTPLETITLKGSAFDVAFTLGKIRRKKIQQRIVYWNRFLAKLYAGKGDSLRAMEMIFLQGALSLKEYVEELRAMAEGADIPFEDLFRLNLTELKAFTDKCTTVAMPMMHQGKKGILLAHNEDWTPKQNDVFILKARLPDVSYTILTYDGYLPGLSCGLNSHGLLHAVNYVRPTDLRAALPRSFVTRYLVTAKSTQDVLKFLHKTNRAFGQSIHLAEKDRYTGIEITAKKIAVRNTGIPCAHANHYVIPELKQYAALPAANSLARQATADDLLDRLTLGKKSLSFAKASRVARQVLSDRSGYPYCIWRNADNKFETSATVATAIMDTATASFKVFRQRPHA